MVHVTAGGSAVEAVEKSRQGLILGALGVVYGDIGTSPLYTIKQCIDSIGGTINPTTVSGGRPLVASQAVRTLAGGRDTPPPPACPARRGTPAGGQGRRCPRDIA